MVIRKATPLDAKGIYEAHTRSIREICCADYNAEQIEAWAGPRKPENYVKAIKNGRFYVAEINGTIAGFSNYDGSELHAVYIHPKYARKGAGKALFTKVCEAASLEGLTFLSFSASITSVPFYRLMGCVVENESTHRFSSGIEIKCLRMRKSLKV